MQMSQDHKAFEKYIEQLIVDEQAATSDPVNHQLTHSTTIKHWKKRSRHMYCCQRLAKSKLSDWEKVMFEHQLLERMRQLEMNLKHLSTVIDAFVKENNPRSK